MSLQDPIADMMTRIRNAQHARKSVVNMPNSKIKSAIAKLLKDEGYVVDFQIENDGAKSVLAVYLKYHLGQPVIDMIKRVSRPGLRVYKSCDDLPKVVDGLGIAIISTSKGLMSDAKARKAGLGGEIIGFVS
jgi:small subunit ribosomal protein S8